MLIPAPPAAASLFSLHSLSSQHFLPPGGGGRPLRRGDLTIRMGGGPRTFPGGVSKWQWKRMQAKKAQQLLKARLARERQLYEMRKRVELRDAVAHLERPWDPDSAAVDVAPNLLSVAADDQLKALADRFHRPGGVDLWNDRDGPRVFESPATGAASARFFPKNAVHSLQPYALRDAAGEAGVPVTRAAAADVLLALGGQGVRENAPQQEVLPAVEFVEKEGTREPLHALPDDNNNYLADWSSDDDSVAGTYESEGTGAMVKRNGRNAVNSMAVGRDNNTGWSGDAFFSDTKEARQGHPEQRWQQRSGGARKRVGGRWNSLDTKAGSGTSKMDRAVAGSISSDSEMIQSGSQPNWRSRSKDDTRNGARRSSIPREDLNSNGFNSNSDRAKVGKPESSWRAQNKLTGIGDFRGRFKPKFKDNTSNGEAPRRHMRSNSVDEHASINNGDGRHRLDSGFAEDLEEPTWKPRRNNRARNGNGGRTDILGGTFRRGDNNTARRLQENTRNINNEGGRRMGSKGGRHFNGDDYSLRPTSDLRSS